MLKLSSRLTRASGRDASSPDASSVRRCMCLQGRPPHLDRALLQRPGGPGLGCRYHIIWVGMRSVWAGLIGLHSTWLQVCWGGGLRHGLSFCHALGCSCLYVGSNLTAATTYNCDEKRCPSPTPGPQAGASGNSEVALSCMRAIISQPNPKNAVHGVAAAEMPACRLKSLPCMLQAAVPSPVSTTGPEGGRLRTHYSPHICASFKSSKGVSNRRGVCCPTQCV